MSTEPEPTPPQPDQQPFARALEGNYHPCDYPEDAAHENGNYATKCQCGTVFIGHKRRMICKVCAETPEPATPQPEPQSAGELKNCRAQLAALRSMGNPTNPEPQPSSNPLQLPNWTNPTPTEWARRAWQAWFEHGGNLLDDVILPLADKLAAAQAEVGRLREAIQNALEIDRTIQLNGADEICSKPPQGWMPPGKRRETINDMVCGDDGPRGNEETTRALRKILNRIAELEAAPTPLPRPDKPGWWWRWDVADKEWTLIEVRNPQIWVKTAKTLWLPATPPPAPKNEEGQG